MPPRLRMWAARRSSPLNIYVADCLGAGKVARPEPGGMAANFLVIGIVPCVNVMETEMQLCHR